MIVETFITNSLREKAYVLYDENTKNGICVDPGNRDSVILDFIKEKEINLKYILLTHGHFDHILGVQILKETGAKIVAHKNEDVIISNPNYNGGSYYNIECTVNADIYVDGNSELNEAGFEIIILETPGHTAGGICYFIPREDIVFTGDTLFRETIGRSDLYTGDFDTLISSIKNKLLVLKDDTICYPGHGENTTIIHEKKHNSFLR